MLALGGTVQDAQEGRIAAEKLLESGAGWEKFKTLIEVQGGDIGYLDDPGRFPKAPLIESLLSPHSGYLAKIDARIVGETSVDLGAGRAKKSDSIDHAVGIEVLHKVGDFVEQGQPVFIVHANSHERLTTASDRLLTALAWSESPVEPLPLFYEVIGEQ
jgi:pyrimidine-nucleoside phosphorylase